MISDIIETQGGEEETRVALIHKQTQEKETWREMCTMPDRVWAKLPLSPETAPEEEDIVGGSNNEDEDDGRDEEEAELPFGTR